MTDLQTRAEPAASAAPEPADTVRGRAGARRRPQAQLALAGALTAFLAFQAGGFFPAAVGVSAAALAVLLALRVTLAAQPFAGWSASAAVVAAAGAGLAAWVVASAAWSSAPGRALVELDRVLLYLLAFAVCAVFPRRPGALATLLRWMLLAIVAVAVAGLATRLVPDAFTAAPGREPARLAFPLTYWNAMGVICAIGLVLALQAASGAREPAWGRVLAGAALPVLVVAGYLPLSRGGIATAALGAVLYLALARPPRLLTTLVTAGPPAGIALAVAYHADALTRASYAQPPGPHEGHRVALVLAACAAAAALLRLAALRLDGRVDRLAAAIRVGGRGRRAALALGVVVAVVAVGFAGGAPAWVHSQYRAFERGNVVDPGSDTRLRLTDAGNNGRLALWRVARRSFAGEPLHGTGAGTYEFAWARERPTDMDAVDAHSLYLETLAELGVVGLILLATMLGGMLVVVGRGLRGGERHASAAVLAAGCALLAHAAIDWDWEMPALFVWLFCAGGVACAAPAPARPAGGGLVLRRRT